VLLAILVYVTLDLSLPAMPGAFVFDPEASVESLHLTRARAAGDVVVVPELLRNLLMPSPPRVEIRARSAPASQVALPRRHLVRSLPRATSDPPAPSEEPH
jgi:hypothetical protein